jgi:hypothetical protein
LHRLVSHSKSVDFSLSCIFLSHTHSLNISLSLSPFLEQTLVFVVAEVAEPNTEHPPLFMTPLFRLGATEVSCRI